jgi:glycosyltransferase involved in cell wall biosynthesis
MKPAWAFVLPWQLTEQGGVNRVVLELMRECAASGVYRPLLIENIWECAEPETCERLGFEAVRVRLRGPFTQPHILRSAAAFAVKSRAARRLTADLVRRFEIAVLNPHFVEQTAWSLLGAGARTVLSFHGSDIRNGARGGWAARVAFRKMLRSADAVVACSRGLLGEVEELAGTLRHARVIYNGARAPVMAGPPAAERGPGAVVVSVGRFEHRKGHDVLLRAFALVAGRDATVELWIVGGTGDALESTRALLEELGLAGRVRLLVDIPYASVAPTMAQADVFVMSSRWIKGQMGEGFPLAILEAGALGLPVVSTRCCGAEEIITNGVTGLLAELDDAVSLAAAIERGLRDRQSAVKWGAALRARVEREFRWSGAWAEYMAADERR